MTKLTLLTVYIWCIGKTKNPIFNLMFTKYNLVLDNIQRFIEMY